MTSASPSNVRSLANACCVITGATSGIGRATALALAPHGAHLVIVGRDAQRARATAAAALAAGASGVDIVIGDLSSQREVCHVADEILARHSSIDTLVNNAGALFLRRQLSVDGIEMTWAVNHLAPFLLTSLLLGALRAGAPARVVNVSSGQHANGRIDFGDPCRAKGGSAYAQSKLANILFTRALARRVDAATVTTCALRPGRVASGFGYNNGWRWRVARLIVQRRTIPCDVAGRTVASLVLDPELARAHGGYFDQHRVATPAPHARDDEAAERLWALSGRMITDAGARQRLA